MAAGTVIAHLLVSGADDWLDMSDVVSAVIGIEHLTDQQPELLRERALDAVERLLAAGFMEAGETPRGGPGFVPWQLGVPETMSRIVYLWDHLRDSLGGRALLPGISEICYLRNTDLGNEIGELFLSLSYTEAFEQGRIPLEP
jgi:hypothetical protein